jgi:hypothetical protein
VDFIVGKPAIIVKEQLVHFATDRRCVALDFPQSFDACFSDEA